MRQPPENFSQLRAAQWAAPLIAGFGAFMAAWMHGLTSAKLLAALTGVCMLASWILAMVAVWGSTWGSRHQLTTVAAEFVFFVVPWCTMLVPRLAIPSAGSSFFSVTVTCTMLVCLLLSAWYHARSCPMPATHEFKASWPPNLIDLKQQTLRVSAGTSAKQFPRWPLAGIAGASVAIYRWLESHTSQHHLIVLGVVAALALGLWLCLIPMGRTLGQAVQLHRLERLRGVKVTSERLPWLMKERQRYFVGRWWRT